jgi:hypothetical protein
VTIADDHRDNAGISERYGSCRFTAWSTAMLRIITKQHGTTAKRALDEKVAELKNAGEVTFERVKADVERRLAEFDTSLQALASRING